MKEIPCSIYRGGTSKGLVIDELLVPPPGPARDQVLLGLIGGADPKQIDGLGGGVTITSKVAMVRPSVRPGIDVDYTFAQVVVGQGKVDYRANCGNMSSTVGPFAIAQGWVKAMPGETSVHIYNINTEKTIVATVPTDGHGFVSAGDYKIAGVQGTGGKITLEFLSPQGAATGRLLPTGNPTDTLHIPELGTVPVSIIDAANLFVFVSAETMGVRGCETVKELTEGFPGLMERLELVRGAAAQQLGYVSDYRKARQETASVPKLMLVAPAQDYTSADGIHLSASEMDIQARMISAMKPHPTMAMTGAMCLAAASVVPGSVVNQIFPDVPPQFSRTIRLAHPGGLMEVGVTGSVSSDVGADCGIVIHSTTGYRTARLLMRGIAFYENA